MLNVRIDKLPPDRKTSSKDCHSCYRRRIRCDRSLPKCRKCMIRGLSCPGFGRIQLKWDQGVASRGVFAGRRTPVRQKAPAMTTKRGVVQSNTSNCASQTVGQDGVRHDKHGPELSLAFLSSPTADRSLFEGHSSLTILTKLFSHFINSVAPRLTWIDSPDHPWRMVILPLARRCSFLHMAILSAAAAHSRFTSAESAPYALFLGDVSQSLRDTCVRRVNGAIQHELELFAHGNLQTDQNSLIEILATTLVLCYGEMVVPGSTNWRLHLHACRILIERQQWREGETRLSDPVACFLLKEVADLEVFYSLGTFTNNRVSPVSALPQSIFSNHFRTFTGLLHEITAEERQRYQMMKNIQTLPSVDMGVWRHKAKDARAQALADTLWLSAQDEYMRNRIDSLLQAYYHASIIYSYQLLASLTERTSIVQILIPQLLREIEEFTTGSIHMFSHNIFLPLFIAGTECWSDGRLQELIDELFLRLVSTTGLWCNYSAMHFLRAFWARPEYHGIGKWYQFARENEKGNTQFIIF
ncbi:fungal-specific transcription factor domain-containing protein [Aspergillus ambiguus]|uniref:Zn(II)2Cys6 transcription factor n=1 Tax=Aspergillus ambiguus TaxID=176160 RepID=UPI003CCD0F95